MTSPLCTHLIPEDQCLHCLTPALRVAIDALARERAEVAMLRGEIESYRAGHRTLRAVEDQVIERLRSENAALYDLVMDCEPKISEYTAGHIMEAYVKCTCVLCRIAALADYDPCASKDHYEAAIAAGGE